MITDEWTAYDNLGSKKYQHSKVNHGKGQYVTGIAHTNSIESFWALLKRGIVGQYHHVTEKHLNAYINEFCFRHNNRTNDEVFGLLLEKGVR